MKESETLEFKLSLTQLKKAVISICAILNKHNKGQLIFGIKDDGKIKGVLIGKSTLRDVSKTISDHIEPKIYPSIVEKKIDGKSCILVSFEGKNTPYFAYGRAYKRTADEDKLLTKAELEKIIISKNIKQITWDTELNKQFKLKDISTKKLKEYVKKAGLEYSSKSDVLEKLGLIKNSYLTNASIILFGDNLLKHFRLLNLRCAVFYGLDKSSDFIDTKDYQGDLFTLINSAEKYILGHINVGLDLIGLRKISSPEINQEALREAIINAFSSRLFNSSRNTVGYF